MKENKQICGRIEMSRNGNAFLIAKTKGIDEDIFISKKDLGQALHGDEVCIELTKDSDKSKSRQGVVMAVSKRDRIDFSGVLEISKDKKYGFVRTSGDKMPVDFFVPIKNIGKAESGDLVVVRLHKWSVDEKSPTGIVLKVLGKPESHEAEMGDIMFRNDVDYTFPADVINESELISDVITDKEISKRLDMRDVLTLAIDPESAKDFDDALSFVKLENENYEIGVHIADVSHYIQPGSKLDEEALKRSTSVYLVDRCVAMLPERLSNGICSLRPGEDKLTFSVIFEITPGGDVINHSFRKTVINSNKKLSYEEAQKILEEAAPVDDSEFAVIKLDDIAKKIRAKRFDGGAITFNKREPHFVLDDLKVPVDVLFLESADSHQLIEEFMLLANRYVATYTHSLSKPYIYRTHDLPNEERLQELSSFVGQFGYNLKVSDNIEKTKESLNNMLKEVLGSNESSMIETLAIRSMSKAVYSTKVIGHYGLGFKHYSHFTSPIRRYSDIIAHRLLWQYLRGKNGDISKLSENCEHCSDMENKAAKAQRESIRYKQCEYLKSRVGQSFNGVISSVQSFGVFIELIDNGCDVMVSDDWVQENGMSIDKDNFCVNFNGEIKYRLGDKVVAKVTKVNMTRKQIDAIIE